LVHTLLTCKSLIKIGQDACTKNYELATLVCTPAPRRAMACLEHGFHSGSVGIHALAPVPLHLLPKTFRSTEILFLFDYIICKTFGKSWHWLNP